jgi:aspartate racemase
LPLPEALRDQFFLESNNRTEVCYVPAVYPGEMLLFRAREFHTDPLLGWGDLVQGGIEVHEVPGAHDNQRMLMAEPSVTAVATILKDYLERIENASGRRSADTVPDSAVTGPKRIPSLTSA